MHFRLSSIKTEPLLTCLPRELIILILQNCQGEDILNLAEAFQNSEIDHLLENQALWQNPKIGPNSLRKYLKYLGTHTKEITVLGFVTLTESCTPKKAVYEKSEYLPESVISSISLRCPNLIDFKLKNCVIDTEKVKLSLFPKSIKNLKFDCVDLLNKSKDMWAVNASPFYGIKNNLPSLETLELENPWYYRHWDCLAILSGCKLNPSMAINGSSHVYTFGGVLSSREMRDTNRHFMNLIVNQESK